jgi:predicted aminopeptidase
MASLTVLGGCRAGYVAKVSAEHLRFLSRAVPIEDEIARTTDSSRRDKLELVLAVRDFAAKNGLDPGGSYAEISDTADLTRAHVVTAAYKDRLEPYVWRYPIVGRMPYRGYFERADADAFAARLVADGLDAYVVEASGYSTLGWFDDPLPSGVLAMDAAGVAGFVLHELTHRRLFVAGHTDFNETLASAVEMRLRLQFFSERGDRASFRMSERRYAAWLDEAHACDSLASALERVFAERDELPLSDLLEERARTYSASLPRLRAVGLLPPEGGAEKLNNAVLLAWYRYRRRVREFESYFDRFPTVAAGLDELERRIGEADDPWKALGQALSSTTEGSPGKSAADTPGAK